MGNDAHDPETGRFTNKSGAEVGDHQTESNLSTRRVSGRILPLSQVVTKHADAPSVGTSMPTVRLDNANSPSTKSKLGSARSDRITQLRATDQRHFGIPGDVGSRVGKMLPGQLRGPSAKGWPYNNS
jgi:hypothetical protein